MKSKDGIEQKAEDRDKEISPFAKHRLFLHILIDYIQNLKTYVIMECIMEYYLLLRIQINFEQVVEPPQSLISSRMHICARLTLVRT